MSIPSAHMGQPMRGGPSVFLIACLAALSLVCACPSCSRGASGLKPAPQVSARPIAAKPTPAVESGMISLGQETSCLLSLSADGLTRVPVTEIRASDRLADRSQRGFFGPFFVLGAHAMAAINRRGFFICRLSADGVPEYRLIEDPAFGRLCLLGSFCHAGRLYAFLSQADALEPGRDQAILLSIAPGEDGPRRERLAYHAYYSEDWKASFIALGSPDRLFLELVKEAGPKSESFFLSWDLNTGICKALGRDAFLSAFEPASPKGLAPGLLRILPVQAGLEHYGFPASSQEVAILAEYGCQNQAGRTAFLVKGKIDAESSVSLFAWEGPRQAALAPDGSLRVGGVPGHDDGAKEGRHNLAPLPYTFDYSGLCLLGDYAIATWEESVFPDIGQCGLVFYRY